MFDNWQWDVIWYVLHVRLKKSESDSTGLFSNDQSVKGQDNSTKATTVHVLALAIDQQHCFAKLTRIKFGGVINIFDQLGERESSLAVCKKCRKISTIEIVTEPKNDRRKISFLKK